MLTSDDAETVMNAAGTLGTLVSIDLVLSVDVFKNAEKHGFFAFSRFVFSNKVLCPL